MIEGAELELFERSIEHATEHHTGAALDGALAEIGWHEALSDDTRAAVSLLFAHQGVANVTSCALDRVLAHALGSGVDAVVLPAIGQRWSPGISGGARIRVHGVGTASLREPGTAVVVARSSDAEGSRGTDASHGYDGTDASHGYDGTDASHGTDDTAGSYAAFEVEVETLPRRPIAGIDPSLGLVEVEGEVAGAREVGSVDWGAAMAIGQLALGHELVGASRRMLELACAHSLERVQFGRPIAKFQAIRHRLAETLVAVEAADALLEVAWLEGTPDAAAMAKATAGRNARTSARHCQQVLAGMGFTTEHPFHRYVRRILVLEQLLGSTRVLTRELGTRILQRGKLPLLLPL